MLGLLFLVLLLLDVDLGHGGSLGFVCKLVLLLLLLLESLLLLLLGLVLSGLLGLCCLLGGTALLLVCHVVDGAD